MIVGISRYHITEWQALSALVELGKKFNSFNIKYYNNEGFHPKLFLFELPEESWIVIGSSNLTGAGLSENVEANAIIKVRNKHCKMIEDMRSFWQLMWHDAEPLTMDIVKKYQASFPDKNVGEKTNAGVPKTPLPKTVSLSNFAVGSSYWKIAPGKQGWKWPEWKKAIKKGRRYVGIGWGAIGSLESLSSASKPDYMNEVKRRITRSKYETDPSYAAGQFWRFCREMQDEHIIVAYSKKTIFGIGYVDGPYYYESDDKDYPHRRGVRWTNFPEGLPIKKEIWRPLATNNVINAIRDPMIIKYLDRLIS